MCGVTVRGGQECRPKRIAFPFCPTCIVSGSSRGTQAATQDGRTRRGWEQGARVPVVSWDVMGDVVGTAVRRSHTCRERVLGVLVTRKKRPCPVCLCERRWVFARVAVSRGSWAGRSRRAASRLSEAEPLSSRHPTSPPPCMSVRVSGVLLLQWVLAAQGGHGGRGGLRPAPAGGRGAAQAPTVLWAGRRDGMPAAAPRPPSHNYPVSIPAPPGQTSCVPPHVATDCVASGARAGQQDARARPRVQGAQHWPVLSRWHWAPLYGVPVTTTCRPEAATERGAASSGQWPRRRPLSMVGPGRPP